MILKHFFSLKIVPPTRLRRLGDFILIAGILLVIADNLNHTPKKNSLMDKGPTYSLQLFDTDILYIAKVILLVLLVKC